MSALVLQNNALWHIFEDFTPSILLSAFFLIYVIRNNNELNKKLIGEIAKINSRDAGYFSEAQKILSMVNNVTTRLNNIKEACCNDFGNILSEFTSIKISIEALWNEMI